MPTSAGESPPSRQSNPNALLSLILEMLKFLIIAVLTLGVVCNNAFGISLINSVPHATYVWQQTAEGDWQAPASWTPARSTPAPSDILVFNIGGTTTATNVPTEMIGQLIVSGSTTLNLRSTTVIALSVTGGEGDDLVITSGSALNFDGANAITCNLVTGATASVSGSISFSSSSIAGHRLLGTDVGAVTFYNGAVFIAESTFIGHPFGTSNLDSVIFDDGSSYVCRGGDDPFRSTGACVRGHIQEG